MIVLPTSSTTQMKQTQVEAEPRAERDVHELSDGLHWTPRRLAGAGVPCVYVPDLLLHLPPPLPASVHQAHGDQCHPSRNQLSQLQHARKTRSLLSMCIQGIASDNTTPLTLAATERGDLPGPSKLPPLPPAPPRVERGVGAPLAAPVRVERGVADVSAGLCKNFEGLMPGTDRVERGLEGTRR